MDSGVEKLVWERARKLYGRALGSVLSEALAGYNRSPGYDEMIRLCHSIVGPGALALLTEALERRWPRDNVQPSDLYVELRSRLRSYLGEYLLRKIVLEGGHART